MCGLSLIKGGYDMAEENVYSERKYYRRDI